MVKSTLIKLVYLVVGLFVFVTVAPAAIASEPVYGGTLRFGINQDYPTLGNPASQPYGDGYPLTDVCLESLFMLNAQGEPVPWLATSYKFSDDGLTLTIKLRDGVKFHDGTMFDAAAAKWNLDQVLSAKKPELVSVKSVEVIDNSAIRLNLEHPDGLLLVYLGGMRGMMMSPTAFKKAADNEKDRIAWAEANPIGTGPFKFVIWEHDVKIEFTKNNDYWQEGKPYLDKIVFYIINNETTMLSSFRAGELDVIYTQKMQNIKSLDNEGKYNLIMGNVKYCSGLGVDSKHADSPWSDIRVRQAANYAIDCEQFAKTVGFGYWKATNQFDAPERWGYNPNVVGYPYNPEKAKQLLTEAGYPNGFTTNLYGMSHHATLLAALQGYLARVGIKAETKIVTPAERINMFSQAGWHGVWIWGASVAPTTLMNMGRNFTAAAAKRRMTSLDVPAEYSELVSKAIIVSDPATQKKLTWELQKKMVDEYAFITFTHAEYFPLPTTKKVHGLMENVNNHWTPDSTWKEK